MENDAEKIYRAPGMEISPVLDNVRYQHMSRVDILHMIQSGFIGFVVNRRIQISYAVVSPMLGLLYFPDGILVVATMSVFYYCLMTLLFIGLFGPLFGTVRAITKKGIVGEHQFEFNDVAFVERTEWNETLHSYAEIKSVKNILGNLCIQVGNGLHILPGKDFGSREKMRELHEFLRERIGS